MVLNFNNLFNTESKKSKLSDFQDLDHLNGLAISITSAGLYNPPRDDLVLFYFRNGANYASVYTKSTIVSENIKWNKSIGNKIKVPNNQSEWSVKGNKFLSEKSPVILEWNNGSGLKFIKKIELDEKYLFRIKQEVQNNTKNNIELYPYAQITRNKKPDDIMDFYILHEGFIGVFDGELKEDGYDDIKEKKIVREAENGWLGITDKYLETAIVPPKN